MEVIVTHTNSDFDALASLIAAKKLYPEAELVLPGSSERAVREFMLRFEKELNLLPEKKVDLDKITRLIIVDTRHAGRIGRFGDIARKKGLEIHLYDHHSAHPDDLKGKINVSRITGATVTILLEIIQGEKMSLSPFEATLILLGLYQDTGSLSYPSTTEPDRRAAQYLISSGADLKLISIFLKRKLTREQITLYRRLKKSKETFFFGGAKVVILSLMVNRYIVDLALLTQRLMDEEKADVILSLVGMGKHFHLVARSKSKEIDVEEIVSSFGGGGHPTAAYARIASGELPALKKNLLKILRRKIKKPGPEEWHKVISPANLDSKRGAAADHPVRKLRSVRNFSALMKKRLPQRIMRLLKEIGTAGTKRQLPVFVVGGFVRDLMLGRPNYDLDIVVEGDGIAFAGGLAAKWKGKVRKHKKFGTAVVYLSGGFKIDVATARTEYYHYPAVMPQVKGSSLEADLYRRDFTINAMAVCLNKNEFGHLVDFFGGEKDLKKKIIRCLHDLSFVEDPTRIFRAVRFEQRYGFKISRHAQHLIKTAINLEMFDWLTNHRLFDELILILSEKKPLPAIKRMAEFNELRFIHPRIKLNKNSELLFRKLSRAIAWFKKEFPHEKPEVWSIYFLCLLEGLNKEEAQEVVRKFVVSKKNEKRIVLAKESGARILNNLKKKKLKNSEIFQQLRGLPLEVLLFLLAKTEFSRVEKRIKVYITVLRKVRPLIKGKDLAGLGISAGPIYKEIFRAILWKKLDGGLKTKKEERFFIKETWRSL
ncbi:MAG: DHHA1 domain-containing protein [Candidatus Ratteibacteria bacterium]|nr:DHHA1 domain-containing protein [Candidatus Ratteibacteria bacterium]